MKSNSRPLYLGIDTSVYTTSIAAIFEDGSIKSKKETIKLPKGERNIKQSAVVYKHIRRLPEMLKVLDQKYSIDSLNAIAVSAKPRPFHSSYMPVFEAGKSIARVLSTALGVPLYEMSHQENHIEAILAGTKLEKKILEDPFLAVHFSGEESEILMAQLTKRGYSIQRVAGSLDLDAGMLIDRVGLKLDLSFPAGEELEQIALNAVRKDVKIPTRLRNNNFLFSGQENYIRNLIDRGVEPEEIAYGLFKMIGKTLTRSIKQLVGEIGYNTILFSGGVMSNLIIRKYLIKKLKKKDINLYFAPPKFCSDNAIGNASLAKRLYEEENNASSDIHGKSIK